MKASSNRLTQIILALGGISALTTVVMAACYVCGETTCTWTGSACTANSSVTMCENAPRNANEGEKGKTNLTATERDALCWTFSSEDSEDWYQGPCNDPPTPGFWRPLNSCGLGSGQCCWTKVDYKQDGDESNAGYPIKDCSGIACVGLGTIG